jgi:hypothetical protein
MDRTLRDMGQGGGAGSGHAQVLPPNCLTYHFSHGKIALLAGCTHCMLHEAD